jgi:hypothetical protein
VQDIRDILMSFLAGEGPLSYFVISKLGSSVSAVLNMAVSFDII